jgi:hypothetical protein
MDIYSDRHVPVAGLRQSVRNAAYLSLLAADAFIGRLDSVAAKIARSIDWTNWQPGRPTVLCLQRATFIKDIGEMRLHCDINFVTLPTTIVKTAQELWIPPEWRMQSYFTRFVDEELAAYLPYLERFGEALLRAAGKTHPIDAILAANTDYWQDEALRRGASRLGLPFLVLCRENYTIKQDQANVLNHYKKARFRYTGTAVAVYSNTTRDVMKMMGAYPENSVWVTGAPRFDRWREIKYIPLHERDCVTLLSYAYPIYEATENFREAASIFAEMANKRPDLRFVLKLKKDNEAADALALCPQLKQSRVEFVADWPLFDLLPRSRAVIGCNSLAVAEALLADTAVIVPAWRDALANSNTCLYHYSVPAHQKCIYFPRSAQDFSDLLEKAVRAELPSSGTAMDRRACFAEHLHSDENESSSVLVERFIRHYISQKK